LGVSKTGPLIELGEEREMWRWMTNQPLGNSIGCGWCVASEWPMVGLTLTDAGRFAWENWARSLAGARALCVPCQAGEVHLTFGGD
jgi:hypothetical protein